MLSLKQVNKIYRQGKVDHHVLKDVNLHVKKGEFMMIMGPSGSGKTTLLNLIGLLDRPTCGELVFMGQNVLHLKDKELSKLRNNSLGFVFQNYNLISTKTGLENVILPLNYSGIPKTEAKVRGRKILEQLGLLDHANHYPDEMSGGQQQRVSIARALINSPDLILADEPTGNLDSETGHQVMELLKSLHVLGQSILMVTHDQNLVYYADSVVEMLDGGLIKKEVIR